MNKLLQYFFLILVSSSQIYLFFIALGAKNDYIFLLLQWAPDFEQILFDYNNQLKTISE
jgi:hypothetical protein